MFCYNLQGATEVCGNVNKLLIQIILGVDKYTLCLLDKLGAIDGNGFYQTPVRSSVPFINFKRLASEAIH